MQSFKDLPIELIDHIFDYVPEYGYRVEKELHEWSLCNRKVSAYCDLYRYCARLYMSPFNACVTVLTTDNVHEDVKNATLRYLAKNRRAFLYEYLKNVGWIPDDVLSDLGFTNIQHWTKMSIYYETNDESHIYVDITYYAKVLDLYTLMILRENEFMSKKEFDYECSLIVDIDIILEIILSIYTFFHHIFNAVVRYLPEKIGVVTERIKRKQAVVDRIVHNIWYQNEQSHIEYIQRRLQAPKIKIDVGGDKGVLRQIRDQLMCKMKYDDCWDENTDVDHHSLFSMIESLADDE